MDCEEFRGRLDRYVDGELAAAAEGEARAHLRACPSCAKAEAGLRHLKSSLKRVVSRHRPPHELEREVLRALRSSARGESGRGRAAQVESPRDATPVWRAKVVLPLPFFALLVLSLVALAGLMLFARAPAREEVSTKRPSPSAPHAPPGEASGGLDFSRYYCGERASIQVVQRAGLEGR
ncbi:MAG TPA: zf-HC2 domain-containing protein [Pyrinomonadaceae bacterium]